MSRACVDYDGQHRGRQVEASRKALRETNAFVRGGAATLLTLLIGLGAGAVRAAQTPPVARAQAPRTVRL